MELNQSFLSHVMVRIGDEDRKASRKSALPIFAMLFCLRRQFATSAYLRRKYYQTLIIAVAGPDTATGDQVEVVSRGWPEDGVDYRAAGGCGGIGDGALDDEMQFLATHSGHINIIARDQILQRPEDCRIAADAIYMSGNYRAAHLARRSSPRVPEDMRPVGRVDGLGGRRVHQPLRRSAYIQHRRVNANCRNA